MPLRRGGLRVRAYHPLRGRFPAPSPRLPPCDDAALQPRGRLDAPGLGSSLFARRYWGNHCYFLFLRVLRCFSSPRSPPDHAGCHPSGGGLPHSGTRGSKAACASPRIFAACRALLRLQEPGHPPCALIYFLGRAGVHARDMPTWRAITPAYLGRPIRMGLPYSCVSFVYVLLVPTCQ